MSFVENNNIQIYYELLENPDKPYLVLQHGNGNRLNDWYSLGYVDALQDHFQLVLIDCRGFGKSSRPHNPEAYTREHVCSDVIAVLDHLSIKQSHFLGGSRGGRIGYALSQLYPERFLTFTFAGAEPFGESSLVRNFAPWLEKMIPEGPEEFLKKIATVSRSPIPEAIKETMLQNDLQAMYAANINPWPAITVPQLQQIKQPCLFIVGALDEIASKVERAEGYVTNSELQVIPTYDHGTTYWDGGLTAQFLLAFINKQLNH